MAKAQFISKVVQRPHRQRFVTLTLTEGEADLILDLVSQVKGSPSESPRKYARRIRRALTQLLGYTEVGTDAYSLRSGKLFKYHTYAWRTSKKQQAFVEEITVLKEGLRDTVRGINVPSIFTGKF